MSQFFETPGALCDYDFDSVSRRSSTVVDSDYAAERVRYHELNHQFRVPIEQTATTNAINIQIQVQNNRAIATSEVNSVERVTYGENVKEKINCGGICRQQKLRMVFLLIILLVIVAIVVTSILTFYKKMNDNKVVLEESTSTQTTTRATSSEPKQSSEPTKSPLTTTTKDPFEIVKRSEWGANLVMKGTKKLKLPVKLFIIMDTQSETCENMTDCSIYLKEKQRSEYVRDPAIKDLKEHFFIASDGTVYEGRKTDYEGQHTYDRQRTDYNTNSIGIAFIGNYTGVRLTSSQEAAISMLIQKSIGDGIISENYLIFHQEQLALTQNLSENILYKTIQSWNHWSASPTIISKKQWGGLERKGSQGFSSLIIEKTVAVGDSNDSSCSDLLSCSEIMRKIQLEDRDLFSDVRYNFYLGGEDLIFQGRSFDWKGAITASSLDVLFIGSFKEDKPSKSLMEAFDAFLQFAVNVGKLTEDYLLYGQRQLIQTNSPSEKLFECLQEPPFDAHFDFNVTTPKPCEIGCTIRL